MGEQIPRGRGRNAGRYSGEIGRCAVRRWWRGLRIRSRFRRTQAGGTEKHCAAYHTGSESARNYAGCGTPEKQHGKLLHRDGYPHRKP
jgi:hypothetical protein